MHQIIFLVIAAVLAIAATVLAFIFIVPEKRREKMNAFGRFLQDLCSFKFLVVEKILQALYIFSTAFIVLYGVMQLFNIQRDYWSGGVKWMGGMGLLYIVLGPIVVRLSYELLMMVVLLVKNVIAINHKLADQTGRAAGDVFATPDVQELKVAVLQRKTQAPAQEPVQAAWAPVQPPMQEPIQAPVQLPRGGFTRWIRIGSAMISAAVIRGLRLEVESWKMICRSASNRRRLARNWAASQGSMPS